MIRSARALFAVVLVATALGALAEPSAARPASARSASSASVETPTGPVWLQTVSDTGEYIGGGRAETYTPDVADFGAYVAEDRHEVHINVGGEHKWHIQLGMPPNQAHLVPGTYQAVDRLDRGPDDATIEVDSDNRGCGRPVGSFTVDDVAYRGDELVRLAVRFRQDCPQDEPGLALTGEVHWDADAPRPTNYDAPIPVPDGLWRAPAGTFDPALNQVFTTGLTPDGTTAAGNSLLAPFGDAGWKPPTDTTITTSDAGGIGTYWYGNLRLTFGISIDWSSRQDRLLPGLYRNLGPIYTDPVRGGFKSELPGGVVCGRSGGTTDLIVDEVDSLPNGRYADLSLRWLQPCADGTGITAGEVHFQEPGPDGVPGMPTAITANVDGSTATIGWQPPGATGASSTTGYDVVTYTDGEASAHRTASATATSASVTGLEEGHRYTFKVAAVNAQGTGRRSLASPAVAAPGPDLGPFPTVEAFVQQQHRDFTGTSATPAVLAREASALRLGTMTSQLLIRTFVATPAWRNPRAEVIRLFQRVLRPLAHLPRAHVLDPAAPVRHQRGAASPSRWRRTRRSSVAGGRQRDATFVDAAYRSVLGRPPDAARLHTWLTRLRAGASRGDVMLALADTPENTPRVAALTDVVLIYAGLLHRAPTETQLAAALAPASDPSVSRSASVSSANLVRHLIAVSEYRHRVA